MDTQGLIELLPHLVAHIEDFKGFRTELPPAPGVPGGSIYASQNGAAVVTFMADTDAVLRITAGVAKDLDMQTDVAGHTNDVNAKLLMVGRAYYRQTADGSRAAVLVQEIVECKMFDSGPSVNVLLSIIASVGGMAARLSPDFCNRHGGRPWSSDEALTVSMLG